MKTVAIIAVIGLIIGVWFFVQPRTLNLSGSAFNFRSGSCVFTYSRRGRVVIDVLITPPRKSKSDFDPIRMVVTTDKGNFPFGDSGRAYVFDGDKWLVIPIAHLHEGRLPRVEELEQCSSIIEIAERVIGRKIER